MSDLLKTFREQGEPAPEYCAHMDVDGCLLADCAEHFCHLGDLECELVQAYSLGWNEALHAVTKGAAAVIRDQAESVRIQPAPRSGT